MGLTLLIFVAGICKLSLGLTCLQCDNVPQPRHCKTVGECFSGEVCGVEKFTNSFGEELFNVGCVEKSKCTSSSNTDDCIECCQTDLCNAKGCGENGYPLSRGPICYSCPVYTDSKPCHTIQFCGMGEVCMSEAHSEFGDIVYSSKCTNTHVCKSGSLGGPNIVGRDLDGISEDMVERSVGHVCRQCCHEDTCNRHCNSTNTGTSTSLCERSSPCQNGECYDIPGDYVCVCDNGFDGQQCNISTSLCQRLNPCQNGKCYDIPGDYDCVCNDGYTGKQCNISNNHCLSSPCQNSTCYNIPGDYVCVCNHGYEGKQCNIQSSLCQRLSPCMNGNCYDKPGDYVCVCDEGYGGKQCNESISHCLPNPCQNGTCYDIPGDFRCVCGHGYTGKHCNKSISHCLPNPCQNGTCYDIPGDFRCVCGHGYTGKHCNKSTLVASDCYDILHMNLSTTSGVYSVTLWKSERVIEVFCDMDTEKGGWTVFQRRFNGSVDFYRNFHEYENGFGSPGGELWLGLSSIQEMTATRLSELRIDLTAANGNKAYELFQNFSLGMAPKYTLHITSGTGTAGDSRGLSYSNTYYFYTYDHDTGYKCAAKDHGGWWYGSCAHANLNGEYGTPGNISSYHSGEGGFIYRDFQSEHMLRESVMMFRRVKQN